MRFEPPSLTVCAGVAGTFAVMLAMVTVGSWRASVDGVRTPVLRVVGSGTPSGRHRSGTAWAVEFQTDRGPHRCWYVSSSSAAPAWIWYDPGDPNRCRPDEPGTFTLVAAGAVACALAAMACLGLHLARGRSRGRIEPWQEAVYRSRQGP